MVQEGGVCPAVLTRSYRDVQMRHRLKVLADLQRAGHHRGEPHARSQRFDSVHGVCVIFRDESRRGPAIPVQASLCHDVREDGVEGFDHPRLRQPIRHIFTRRGGLAKLQRAPVII